MFQTPSSPETKAFHLLILNDGQDASSFHLEEVLQNAYSTGQIYPTLVVAIHVGERKQEYGISEWPDFAKRGSKAQAYASFISKELMPWLSERYSVSVHAKDRAIAGFSLGALSAFDVSWHNPEIFGVSGLFSGSFWWRAKALDEGYQPSDRLALQLVEESKEKKPLRLWFQTGWLDEFADRDADGLIDSLGDTLDLIFALRKKKYKLGLELEYFEMGNGRHDHKTMAKALPYFLTWWQKAHRLQESLV